jgi:stage IV sporulation protein B
MLGSTTTPFRQFARFPSEIRLLEGQLEKLRLWMPVSAVTSVSDPNVVGVNGSREPMVSVDLHQPVTVASRAAGQARLTFKLFGTVPIKQVKVQVLPQVKVIPGGQSIGVKLKSAGVLVVGHHAVGQDEKSVSPAEKADIRVGDYLVKVDGKPVAGLADVALAAEKAGKAKRPLSVTLIRDGREKTVNISPMLDPQEKVYRLGLYIRESAAGVGTLTFFDPEHKVYGALGHMIADADTGQPIRVGSGKIVRSNVTSIQKGESGEPGEKIALFLREDQVLGNITKNTPFGIFGSMDQAPSHGQTEKAIPVALADQVQEGPAQMLTVVEGQKVEAFDIRIVHVMKQKYPATKGLIIKVTDPRLLNKTGGIVQGMSGSPIIQDGKLVGAVTHVFVNDPTSGYGTLIEWMLQDAGVFDGEAANTLQGFAAFSCAQTARFREMWERDRRTKASLNWESSDSRNIMHLDSAGKIPSTHSNTFRVVSRLREIK